jgi:hypothetical protein
MNSNMINKGGGGSSMPVYQYGSADMKNSVTGAGRDPWDVQDSRFGDGGYGGELKGNADSYMNADLGGNSYSDSGSGLGGGMGDEADGGLGSDLLGHGGVVSSDVNGLQSGSALGGVLGGDLSGGGTDLGVIGGRVNGMNDVGTTSVTVLLRAGLADWSAYGRTGLQGPSELPPLKATSVTLAAWNQSDRVVLETRLVPYDPVAMTRGMPSPVPENVTLEQAAAMVPSQGPKPFVNVGDTGWMRQPLLPTKFMS